MRVATARRGLERVGDVTFVLLDEQPPDRPGGSPEQSIAVLRRRAPGLRYRWPVLGAALGGRGRVADTVAAGAWDVPAHLDAAVFDLGWFVKAGALLAWPGDRPPRVVLDVDDLEEHTRTGKGASKALDAAASRGLRDRLARRVDLLVACSREDQAHLPPGAPSAVVANAGPRIDVPVPPPSTEANLLFVGVLGYGPNRDGLTWFVREVLPLIERTSPGVRVRVVGPQADRLPSDVLAVVDAVGPVADLAPHYAWSRIVVVPVLHGSGTRVKILDAFAYGRGVVSTPVGAAGLDLRPGTEVALGAGAEQLAQACADALEPNRAEELAAAGLAVVAGRLSADVVERQVADVAVRALTGSRRLWVDVTSVRGRTGTPHGMARVEAGLARAMASGAPDAAALWVDRHGLHPGENGDLLAVTDGRDQTSPAFSADPSPRPLGRIRARATAAAGTLPRPAAALAGAGVDAVVAVRDLRRQRRVRADWRDLGRPGDVLLVAGPDWSTGMVDAIAALPPGRRPQLWVVVHDLVPLTHPDVVDAGVPSRFARWISLVTATAAGVVAVSQATADAIEAAADRGLVPRPRRTIVVHPAVEVADRARPPRPSLVPSRPYVVYLATIEPRKNHRILVDAVRGAAAQGIRLPTIVWVGSWAWGTQELRAEVARDPILCEAIVHVDGLPDDQVRWVLENAAAAVFPSSAEGFGLPVAEARLLGVPVIASDLAAVREAAGGVGTFLDPDDVESWRTALADVLQDPSRRDRPAAARTWSAAAAEILDAIGADAHAYGGGLSVGPPT